METSGNYSNMTHYDGNKLAADYRSELMTIYIWPFVFVVICTVFGVIGNTMVLYVYVFHWEKCKSRVFFITLATLNFVNSAFNMPIETLVLWTPLEYDHHWLCKTSRGMSFLVNDTCVTLFISIAIDRLLIVYKPFTRRLLTVRYAKICSVTCILLGAASAWPGFVFYGTATVFEEINGVNVTGQTCYLSDRLMSEVTWPKLFSMILFMLTIIAFLVIIVMYILIGRKIYHVTRNSSFSRKSKQNVGSIVKSFNFKSFTRSSLKSKDSSQNEVVQNKTLKQNKKTEQKSKTDQYMRRVSGTNFQASRDNTITLLLVTMTFIVSFAPYITLVTLRYMDEEFYHNLNKSGRIAYHVFLRFYFLNSTISPFIFEFTNRRFREKVKHLFWTRWRKQTVVQVSRSTV